MERLFAEPDFLTNAQRPLPMTPEEQTPFSQELCDRQKRHKARLRQRHEFARAERGGINALDLVVELRCRAGFDEGLIPVRPLADFQGCPGLKHQ